MSYGTHKGFQRGHQAVKSQVLTDRLGWPVYSRTPVRSPLQRERQRQLEHIVVPGVCPSLCPGEDIVTGSLWSPKDLYLSVVPLVLQARASTPLTHRF